MADELRRSPRVSAIIAPIALCTDNPKAVGDSTLSRAWSASSSRQRLASP
jgi:hypothetical protein